MFSRRKILYRLLLAAMLPFAAELPAAAADTPLTPVTAASTLNTLSFSWDALGSPYIIAISTDPLFLVQAATGSVAGNTTTYVNLGQDTTYYFRVKRGSEGDSAYSINGKSTSTWVNVPTGPYFISSFFTSDSPGGAGANIGWSTNGNPEWTAYELEYHKTGGPVSTARKNFPPVILGGLEANTTYFVRLRARGVSGMTTAYTAPEISTATLALKVSGVSHTIYETSATVNWTPVNGSAQSEKSEGYRLILSTSELLFPLKINWQDPDPATASTLLDPLDRNTTYYYKTGSLNWYGAANTGDIRYFTTLAALPQNLTRLAMTDAGGTLGWTALPSHPLIDSALGYRLEASTNNFSGGGVIESSTTYNVAKNTLTLNTLEPNTTYYFRTSSLNSAYTPNYTASQSSITLALALSPHPSLTAAYPAAQYITVDFTPLPAAPQALTCEGYRVEATTGAFGGTAPLFSSTTYDNQTQLLTVDGLAPNNLYQLRIATLNWERTPHYTLLPSTRTAFPDKLAHVTLDHVWSSSAVISFDSGIAAEGHVAQASVDRFFQDDTVSITSATPNTAATTLTITGLLPNTVYYYRAGALYNGTTIYTNTAPDTRQTLPMLVTGMSVAPVFYSSVTVSWNIRPGSPPDATAEGYQLEVATSSAFSPVLSSSITRNISLDRLTVWSLLPNTSYYFRTGTLNHQGYANYTAAYSTVTLANPPVPQAFGLTPDSISLTWLANSNPPDTRYLVEMADNSGFSPALTSSTTLISSATFSSLAPNTTYYSRVTAINRLDRNTPVVNFAPMATGAYDPLPDTAYGIGVTGLTAKWAAGGNTPLTTSYRTQISSNSDFSGTVLSSVTKNLYASFEGLVSDASYYLRVSALNLSGVPTLPPVSLGTALTLPATAYILPWESTFSGLLTDGFSVSWASNGNSSFTVYQVQASTVPDFTATNTVISTRALSCSFVDLQINTSYWIRLRAQGQSGALSDFEEAGSTRTLLSSLLNAGAQQDNLITLKTSYGDITVLVPSGAIGGSTRLTLMPSTFTLPSPLSAVSQLTPTGIGLVINYFPSPLILNKITITLPYRINDLPAPMRADRSKLILALYDEINGIWVPLPSISDTANNRVIGQTWHLSTFQIMQAQPEAGLSNVKIYPNPYRPNSVSDVMHFTNLTPGARVKIYTFVGELVREIKADVNGMAHWDGLNNAGRKAASGVYIAFIQTKDRKSGKSFKVALER